MRSDPCRSSSPARPTLLTSPVKTSSPASWPWPATLGRDDEGVDAERRHAIRGTKNGDRLLQHRLRPRRPPSRTAALVARLGWISYEREPRWFPLIGRSLRDGPALLPVYGWDSFK